MKQAIVLTSFGALDDGSRERCLDALEADFRAEFPEAVIVQAFTSVFIRNALEKRGIHLDSLEDALLRLAKEDVTHVLVQPTYMTPGEEFEKKVLETVPKYASGLSGSCRPTVHALPSGFFPTAATLPPREMIADVTPASLKIVRTRPAA